MRVIRITTTEIVRMKYGASTSTLSAVRITSIVIVRAKPGASTAAITALRIASTDIVRVKHGATTKFLGESPKWKPNLRLVQLILSSL